MESLYNLVRASPYIFHFLNSPSGAAALDRLVGFWGRCIKDEDLFDIDTESDEYYLAHQEPVTLPWVPLILRLIALVRNCSIVNQPADSLESLFVKFCLLGTPDDGCVYLHDIQFPLGTVPQIRLEDVVDGTQSFSPRKMLFLIRKIIALSEECFQFFHARLDGVKPQHLAHRSYNLGPLPWNDRPDGQPWGESYEFDSGLVGPSWREMQSLIFGFCNLQLRYELSNAIHEGRLDWPSSDVEVIRDLGSVEKCLPDSGAWFLLNSWESVWSALLYVQSLEGVPDESSCLGNVDAENRRLPFTDPGFNDPRLNPLKGGYLHLPQPKLDTPDFKWPITASRQPLLVNQDNSFAINCSYSIIFNGGCYAQDIFCWGGAAELAEGLSFRPFRRLGFGIWDVDRLGEMQMLDNPTRGRKPKIFEDWPENQLFTWISLLSPEEKEGLRAYQEGQRLKRESESEELSRAVN
ncbi:hypothetical protein ACHAPU_006206 [Fusarium lateritium]